MNISGAIKMAVLLGVLSWVPLSHAQSIKDFLALDKRIDDFVSAVVDNQSVDAVWNEYFSIEFREVNELAFVHDHFKRHGKIISIVKLRTAEGVMW